MGQRVLAELSPQENLRRSKRLRKSLCVYREQGIVQNLEPKSYTKPLEVQVTDSSSQYSGEATEPEMTPHTSENGTTLFIPLKLRTASIAAS